MVNQSHLFTYLAKFANKEVTDEFKALNAYATLRNKYGYSDQEIKEKLKEKENANRIQ